jgi:hypothetical protein
VVDASQLAHWTFVQSASQPDRDQQRLAADRVAGRTRRFGATQGRQARVGEDLQRTPGAQASRSETMGLHSRARYGGPWATISPGRSLRPPRLGRYARNSRSPHVSPRPAYIVYAPEG